MENKQFNSNVQPNYSIRGLAKSQLKGNWTLPVITTLAYFIIVIALDAIPIPGTEIDMASFYSRFFDIDIYEGISNELSAQTKIKLPILTMLLGGALSIGFIAFHLTFAKKGQAELPQIFDGFKQFFQSLIAYILISIITIIGFILFIIPGVVLAMGLSQTFYIMADNPGVKAIDAMQQSWEMTKGYKLQLFLMSLSFIPWAFLCLFTCGIGFLWLMPYAYLSFSHFYFQLKGEEFELGIEDHLIMGE